MLIAVSIIVVGCLLVAGVLLWWSPGKLEPIADEHGRPLAGSVSEKTRVEIQGLDQGMFIRGKNEAHPVLIFLHGGPGMPEYFLSRLYPDVFEEDFTVCWWEQRGAGLSYHPGLAPQTITAEQLIADTLAVTQYLRQRFGKDKIYLAAHSWGSYIGLQAAARAPELFQAYLGLAQITYQLKSENQAYAYMLAQFKSMGNTNMVRRLEKAPVAMTAPLPEAYMALRDEAMHTLGIGTTREMRSVVRGIFLPSWQSRVYTLGEKVNLWRGKVSSRRLLWNPMITTDLAQQTPALDLPVYLCHGRHDYTVSYTQAKAYFEKLQAPLKGFYTFEQSAHSPMFEEPEKMRRILREDLLAGQHCLADGK
ncbi:MAG: alpha/beta hydrolase [Anaerolineaceae bacterium]|nr:alpha/beta hydrolase [Anaerolineaceae bacterium]